MAIPKNVFLGLIYKFKFIELNNPIHFHQSTAPAVLFVCQNSEGRNAMADRTTPIHSGYSIINGSFSGTATAKLGCWMEYKVVSQSVENNPRPSAFTSS